jgi:hypothetical protein
MRKEKALIELLRGLIEIVSLEAENSPEFAAKLDTLLQALPDNVPKKQPTERLQRASLPDVHAELALRGEGEFRLWLRDLPVDVLRGLIRAQDLDSTRRTAKWKDAEKLAAFVADGIRDRKARGSAFGGRKTFE